MMTSRFFTTDGLLIDVSEVAAIHCNLDDHGDVFCKVALRDVPTTFYVSQDEASKLMTAVVEYETQTMGSWVKLNAIPGVCEGESK